MRELFGQLDNIWEMKFYPKTDMVMFWDTLWIWRKVRDGGPLSAVFYARDGEMEKIDRPGGIIGENTVLRAPI